MSDEENANSQSGNEADLVEPKAKPKIIRILTVIAYTLSVSMAAILLSIYYVFMWDGHPTLARKGPVSHPLKGDNIEPLQIYAGILRRHENHYAVTTVANIENGFKNKVLGYEKSAILKEKEIKSDNVSENLKIVINNNKTVEEELPKFNKLIPLGNKTNDIEKIIEKTTPKMKENMLVDVPYEPTAIPVVEATTVTEKSIDEDEDDSIEPGTPWPNLQTNHSNNNLVQITKWSTLIRKIILN